MIPFEEEFADQLGTISRMRQQQPLSPEAARVIVTQRTVIRTMKAKLAVRRMHCGLMYQATRDWGAAVKAAELALAHFNQTREST